MLRPTTRSPVLICNREDVGWFLDDDFGLDFIANVQRLGNKYGIPKTIASHKGFALPGFDQRAAACQSSRISASDSEQRFSTWAPRSTTAGGYRAS